MALLAALLAVLRRGRRGQRRADDPGGERRAGRRRGRGRLRRRRRTTCSRRSATRARSRSRPTPAYPPQSSLNEQTGEYEGFDIDVATEIAKRLGVDVAWEAPSWDVITAGSWNGRWDTTVGSMTPTNERQEVLYFTEPYNYTPAVVVVGADNDDVSDLSTDLDGKKIGVCAACTYDRSS